MNQEIVKKGSHMVDRDEQQERISSLVLQFIAGVVLDNHLVAQRLGLGATDGQFLTLLSTHGPLPAGRLAELSGLTTGSVTAVIDRLEKGGYVERVRTSEDKRKVVVTPVPTGLAKIAREYDLYGQHLAGVLDSRSPEELAAVERFLSDMLAVPEGR
jgi:DNA-binding MarR family transcriptional regulator